jgi:hypothetical protein
MALKPEACSPYFKIKHRILVVPDCYINPLTPELNLSAQRCLTRFFAGDFAS